MAQGPVSALTAGDTLLSHFWDLASLEEDTRQQAATALVDILLKDQRDFEAESGAELSEEEEGGDAAAAGVDHALRRCSPLVVYAFKRLCRGLGSSRQGARQGFSLAITSLLGSASCIGPSEAVAAVEGVLEPTGKGSELRDALLGRIFGYAAVVRCGRPLPAGLAASLAAGLVAAAQKKSFLREAAGAVALELCLAVDDATLGELLEGSEAPLAPWLHAPADEAAPEALLLALRLWPRLPPAVATACPLLPPGFRPAKPLPAGLFTDPAAAVGSKAVAAAAAAFFARPHLTALLPVLRATTQSHPRLHDVWPTLLALLMPGFSADKEQRSAKGGGAVRPLAAPLEAFWGCVAEGDLVQSSHERKHLAFTLFLLLLPHLGPEHVPLVFTPAFLRCLALNLKKNDSYLHAAAKKCMERIAANCGKAAAPEVRIAVSLALQRHGGADLERYARAAADKAKPADRETGKEAAGADAASVKENGAAANGEELGQYVQQLQGTFLQAGGGEEGGEEGGAGAQQRQWAVEQLCGVLKQAAAPSAVKLPVLRFLAVHAFFSIDAAAAKKSKDAAVKASATQAVDVPLAQRQLCAARLIALADTLDKQQQQHGKGGRGPAQQQAAAAAQQQQQDYLGGVVAFVAQLRRSGATQLATAAEGEDAAAAAAEGAADTLQATLERLQALAAAAGPQQQRLRAASHLLRLLLLHTLADPASADPGLAADLSTVLAVAVEGRAAPQRAPAGASGSEEEEGGEAGAAQPHWHDTLMDVLLSLLARNAAPLPSAPLRDAVEHAFRAFAEDLTATGMADMLRVLSKPLDSGGAAGEEDVYESSEEEEEEEEEGMKVDGEESEEEEDSEEGEEEEAEGSDSEDEGEGGKADDAEDAAAARGEAEAAGGSSDEEEAMSDEAMFRMDAKLAGYFASLKEGRGGGARTARQELVDFKMRVAALLEAYCKRVPGSPLLPAAVSPLLAGLAGASRAGGNQPLAERLAGLVTHKLCGSKAEAAGAGAVPEELEAQLRRTLYLASRSPDKRVAAAAAACHAYLQRAAAASPSPEGRAKGLESARAALADFFTKKKSRLQRPLLEGWLRRVPPLAPGLLPDLLAAAAAARNDYLRREAFLLLSAALKVGGSGMTAALKGSSPAAAAAVRSAVSGSFAKPQRQVEAVKVACQLLESGKSARLGGGKDGGWQEAREATAAALDAAIGNPKLAAALQRLEGLLAAPGPAQQKRGKSAAAAPKKKQKV